MKRSDEMKLGEHLRGYCDCNQGRLPCTCRDRPAELYRRNLANAVEVTICLNDEPMLPPPTTEYPSDRCKDPIERFSVAAQLQLMKALAILGWTAFFLELLRA